MREGKKGSQVRTISGRANDETRVEIRDRKKGGKTRTGSKVTENAKEDETIKIKQKVHQTIGQFVRDCAT